MRCAVGLERFLPETRAVRTFSWSVDAEPALEGLGFSRAACLRYMTLAPKRAPAAKVIEGFTARVATDESKIAEFSDVQSRGFLSPGDHLPSLYAFLNGANQNNLKKPSQSFYVGYLHGKPVAVTLLLVHE